MTTSILNGTTTNTTVNKSFNYVSALQQGHLDAWILTFYFLFIILFFIGCIWIDRIDKNGTE